MAMPRKKNDGFVPETPVPIRVGKPTWHYKAAIGVLVVIILVMMAVQFAGATASAVSKSDYAEAQVREVFSILTERPISILKKEDIGGIMMFVVSTGNNTAKIPRNIQFYITPSGSYILNNFIDTEQYKNIIRKDKSFALCLADKGVRVLISDNDKSARQISAIGVFANLIRTDCTTNGNYCMQAGVTEFPTTIYKGISYPGIKDTEWFEQTTGCVK